MQFIVQVGFTVSRPIVPDEQITFVHVFAPTVTEATLIAAQMVGTHCEMVTSSRIV